MKPEEKKKRAEFRKRRLAVIRRRRRMLILFLILLFAALFIGILAIRGIFYKKATQTTMTIRSDGSVIFEEYQKLDQNDDTADGMKAYVKKLCHDYNEKNGSGKIKIRYFSVENKKAYLRTSYASLSTYSDFTGKDTFNGTVNEAEKKGYDFSAGTFTDTKGNSVPEKTVVKNNSQMVAIIEGTEKIKVPGTICYRMLSTEDGGNRQYIVYKK